MQFMLMRGQEFPAALDADALLFDLDGVLVDSAACVRRVCTDWAISRGLDPAFVIGTAQGRRVQDTVLAVAPHLDLEAEVEALIAIESRTTDGLAPVSGARELVAGLPPDTWAVVTSGARAVATLRLRHVGVPLPRTLITADDVRHGKPHPEGYLRAAAALGCPPSACIVVEDAPAGIEAARAAGMRSIGIAGTVDAAALDGADVVLPSLQRLAVAVSARPPRLRVRSSRTG